MKYPITVTADGYAPRRQRIAASLSLSDAGRFALRHWGLLAALAFTFAVHLPTLRYFFDGDDFVVLGSVEYLGATGYVRDTFLMRDIVPNWRPLTGAVYAVEWNAFGLNATAWRAFNLSVHMSSMVVLYTLVARVTRRPSIGAVAALVFGVSGAHFDTVTYITALPHVLATFFMLASLLAMVSYTQDGERNKAAYALSFALFTLAFLANEGAFVYAPVIVGAYAAFAARRWLRAPQRLVLHAIPYVALASGWLLFYEACDCQQLKFDGYFWGAHVFSNYAVYFSWIAFPARAMPLDPDAMRWAIAAVVATALLAAVVRGPNIARVAALGIVLALLPFVPVEIWTASRYSYASVAFFAIVASIAAYWAFDRARSSHPLARVPATLVALAFVAAVAGLYAWQSYAQDARSGRGTERWELLVNELRDTYADVPDGTTIYIVGGPWTNPMEQYTWVPSVARTVYGDAAAFAMPAEAYRLDPPDTRQALFLQWTGSGFEPIEPQQVLGER